MNKVCILTFFYKLIFEWSYMGTLHTVFTTFCKSKTILQLNVYLQKRQKTSWKERTARLMGKGQQRGLLGQVGHWKIGRGLSSLCFCNYRGLSLAPPSSPSYHVCPCSHFILLLIRLFYVNFSMQYFIFNNPASEEMGSQRGWNLLPGVLESIWGIYSEPTKFLNTLRNLQPTLSGIQ